MTSTKMKNPSRIQIRSKDEGFMVTGTDAIGRSRQRIWVDTRSKANVLKSLMTNSALTRERMDERIGDLLSGRDDFRPRRSVFQDELDAGASSGKEQARMSKKNPRPGGGQTVEEGADAAEAVIRDLRGPWTLGKRERSGGPDVFQFPMWFGPRGKKSGRRTHTLRVWLKEGSGSSFDGGTVQVFRVEGTTRDINPPKIAEQKFSLGTFSTGINQMLLSLSEKEQARMPKKNPISEFVFPRRGNTLGSASWEIVLTNARKSGNYTATGGSIGGRDQGIRSDSFPEVISAMLTWIEDGHSPVIIVTLSDKSNKQIRDALNRERSDRKRKASRRNPKKNPRSRSIKFPDLSASRHEIEVIQGTANDRSWAIYWGSLGGSLKRLKGSGAVTIPEVLEELADWLKSGAADRGVPVVVLANRHLDYKHLTTTIGQSSTIQDAMLKFQAMGKKSNPSHQLKGTCPACKSTLGIPAGRTSGTCPNCGHKFTVK